MQQATVNLFAIMGVQPATLMSGLAAGTAPTDTTPPTSTITSPSAGATFTNGNTVTISGTATDSGGGVVAGVEVSTNGGSTWHPVTTMSAASTNVTWSYTWSAAGNGPVTIMSRATDDDGNMETPGPGVSVTVNCPCSLFGNNYTPAVTSANDSTAYELGVKFQSTVPGWVAGVRFYKGAGNNGTHTGSLWTSIRHPARHGDVHQRDGQRLADIAIPQPRPDQREHDLCRVLLRPGWPLCRR